MALPPMSPPDPATIVFSHANGFPAGTYRVLFEAWRQAGHHVLALPRFGHDPAYPVASNWRPTRDELIHFIELPAGRCTWWATSAATSACWWPAGARTWPPAW